MEEGIYILVIVGLGGVCGWLFWRNWKSKKEAEVVGRERDEYASFGEGISLYQQKVADKKLEYKNKILDLLKESGRVSNKDVTNRLGVSETTAERYLDELEKEGKIKQIGKTGRNVFYK